MKKFILLLFLIFTACESSKNSSAAVFKVNEGDTIARVATRLVNEGIITQKTPFRIYAKLSGKESLLKTGTYTIPPMAGYGEILDILVSGVGESVLVTIPEGFNIFQIAYLLDNKKIVSAEDFLAEVYKEEWLAKFGIPKNENSDISALKLIPERNNFNYLVPDDPPQHSLEGFLFPDTYAFAEGSSARTVVRSMTDHFCRMISKDIQKEISNKKKSLLDIVTSGVKSSWGMESFCNNNSNMIKYTHTVSASYGAAGGPVGRDTEEELKNL